MTVDRGAPDATVIRDSRTRHVGAVPFEFQPIVSPINPMRQDVTLANLLAYGLANKAQIFELYPQDWVFANDPSAFPSFTGATQAQYGRTLSAAAQMLGRNQ